MQFEGNVSINILNDDCLQEIFRYFPTIAERTRLERVCKRWQGILVDQLRSIKELDITENSDLNWGIPTYDLRTYLEPVSFMKILRACGAGLTMIDTSDNSLLSSVLVEKCGEFCSSLSIVKIRGFDRSVCLDPARSILACRRIRHLAINYPRHESFLSQLFSSMPHLKHVEIHGNKVTAIGNCIFNLPEGLEVLAMSNVTLNNPSFNLALTGLPNLRNLEMNTCRELYKDSLHVISQLDSLHTLKIHEPFLVAGLYGSIHLISQLRNLEILEMTTINNQSLLGSDSSETPTAAMTLLWRYITTTDEFLITIAQNCKRLKSLDVSGSACITDRGVAALASINLERLILNDVPQLTDESLGKLLTLRILECVGCEYVKDFGIITLLHRAPEIEQLDLSLTSITDRTVKAAMQVIARRTSKIPLRLNIEGTLSSWRPTKSIATVESPRLHIYRMPMIQRDMEMPLEYDD